MPPKSKNGGRRKRGNTSKTNNPDYSAGLPHSQKEDIKTDKHYLLKLPSVPSPLAVRTHVRWSYTSNNKLKFYPKPNAKHKFLDTYISGWICVGDWEDITLTAVEDTHVRISIESRGFVQL